MSIPVNKYIHDDVKTDVQNIMTKKRKAGIHFIQLSSNQLSSNQMNKSETKEYHNKHTNDIYPFIPLTRQKAVSKQEIIDFECVLYAD